jgi:hypothetical protein
METLNNDQMRIFNAGQSKNDTYLAELIADRIYEIITQHTLLSKTELCYYLTDSGLKTLRRKEVWRPTHLDSICKHVPWLAVEIEKVFGPKQHYKIRKERIDWFPRSWKQNDLCRRVEHLTWGKKTTDYRCIKTHVSSHMFSLDMSCWEKQ